MKPSSGVGNLDRADFPAIEVDLGQGGVKKRAREPAATGRSAITADDQVSLRRQGSPDESIGGRSRRRRQIVEPNEKMGHTS